MSGITWHNDPTFYRMGTSYLTGREITINLHKEKFLIPTVWAREAMQSAVDEVYPRWRSMEMKSYHKPSLKLWPLLEAFEAAQSIDEFGSALDRLFDARENWGRDAHEKEAWGRESWRATDKTRALELITAFWRQDIIAWPSSQNPFPKQDYTRSHMFGRTQPIIAAFMEATYAQNRSFMRRTIVPLLLKRIGVMEVGDLTAEIARKGLSDTYVANYQRLTARTLLLIQRAAYGNDRVTESPIDFLDDKDDEKAKEMRLRPPERSNRKWDKLTPETFEWVTAKNPSLEMWRICGASWLAEATSSKLLVVTTLNQFFKYALSTPGFPSDPREYFNIRSKEYPPFAPAGRQTCQMAAKFLEWVLDTYLSEEVDGMRFRPPGLRNPLKQAPMPKIRHAESVREAMPTLFIQMLLDILTENDWAWPKQFASSAKQGGDWFVHYNGETGKYTQIWSPVRSVAIWMKLKMPFRTFQIRMLDSGEADTFIYDAESGSMKPNQGHLQNGTTQSPVQKGVPQLKNDPRVGREVAFLRINTNKTADINKDWNHAGYDCPYAPADVLKVLAWLRDWQSMFNPIARPTRWAEVPELVNAKTALQLQGRESCFLFRNPVGSESPAVPVENALVSAMWGALLFELQKRLATQKICGPDAEPYKLVEVGNLDARIKYTPLYDLHSLRVTFITAFYEAGVPAEILMKIVGHSTITMTLYYTKLGAATISAEMEAGQERVIRQTQENWVRHQQNHDLKSLKTAIAWNEDVGPATFAESGLGMVFMDIGVCPVACAKCDLGGAKLTSDKTRAYDFAPVPGGRSNCASCRFIISGPPFLHGLVAHFNAKSLAASTQSARRASLEREFEALDAERRSAIASGDAFMKHREWQSVATNLDQATHAVDQRLKEMNALARLIEQSRRILEEAQHSDKASTALVINDFGALKSVFEETTEFELLDRICQSSVFFQSVNPTDANIRRMRAYDRMLVRNGLQPAFLDMDEETSLIVGNQLSKLFARRIGRADTLNLLEGTETLVRLGFDVADLARDIADITQHRVERRSPSTRALEASHPITVRNA